MERMKIGAPPHLSARPLLFGLTRHPSRDFELYYAEPGELAGMLEQGELDAALIPSIEFLRGVGSHFVPGVSVVAMNCPGSFLLISDVPLEKIRRVAVGEFCRTPLAVLRIVLHAFYGIFPDLCVLRRGSDWRDGFDGRLLGGDEALYHIYLHGGLGDESSDICGLWYRLTSEPLVEALWAYNDGTLEGYLSKLLLSSRNLGLANLPLLAEGLAHTSPFDADFLHRSFGEKWSYGLGPRELAGLKTLEGYALRYKLIPRARPEGGSVLEARGLAPLPPEPTLSRNEPLA